MPNVHHHDVQTHQKLLVTIVEQGTFNPKVARSRLARPTYKSEQLGQEAAGLGLELEGEGR